MFQVTATVNGDFTFTVYKTLEKGAVQRPGSSWETVYSVQSIWIHDSRFIYFSSLNMNWFTTWEPLNKDDVNRRRKEFDDAVKRCREKT